MNKNITKIYKKIWFFLALAIFIGVGVSQAATLKVGSSQADQGAEVTIPINLVSGEGETVIGLNFDLEYLSNMVEIKEIKLGEATEGKIIQSKLIKLGYYRCTIYSTDSSKIGDGTVANLIVKTADTAVGKTIFSLKNVTANSGLISSASNSDMDTLSIPTTVSDGCVMIDVPGSSSEVNTYVAGGSVEGISSSEDSSSGNGLCFINVIK
ncbi:MAG: cohesin domain-containing protein [bacterium]